MIEPWFTQQIAPWFSLLSLFSLLSFTHTWAQKGQHRSLITGAYRLVVGLGILLICLGLIALVQSQPRWVWAALLLAGGLLTPLMAWATRQVMQLYEEAELRKSIANDL